MQFLLHLFAWFLLFLFLGFLGELIDKKVVTKSINDKLTGVIGLLGIGGTLVILIHGLSVWKPGPIKEPDFSCLFGCNDDNDNRYEMGDYQEEPTKGNDNPGVHSVNGYYRSDGTYVEGHMRSNPDGIKSNNLNPNK